MFVSPPHSIIKTIIACGTSSLLFTGVASAQLLSESFSIDNVLCLTSSGNFSLHDFDTTLGTLEGIDFTLAVTGSTVTSPKIQVYNTANHAVGFTNASIAMPGSVTGPGNTTLNATLTTFLASGTAQPGMNFYTTVAIKGVATEDLDSSLFDLWEDQANDKVNFSYLGGNATYQGTDLGNSLLFGGTLPGCGKVTVTYTYQANPFLTTPEPSSKFFVPIVAAAMCLLIFNRRSLAV